MMCEYNVEWKNGLLESIERETLVPWGGGAQHASEKPNLSEDASNVDIIYVDWG
jgi:hypothetical protein